MKFLVQKLEGNPVLDLLGIVKARLISPTNLPPSPYTDNLAMIDRFCIDAKEQGLLNDEEITILKAECEALGLKPSLQAIMDTVLATEVPDELAGDYVFESCSKCGLPVPHGYVMQHNERISAAFMTFEEIFDTLTNNENHSLTPAEVVHLLKQATTLPLDNDALTMFVDALPPEKKRLLDDPMQAITEMLASALGGRVSVIRL